MDERDPNRTRREDDDRWLKVQEQIMNLVTAERTDQQELAAMKTEVSKLNDHVDDLDDYLRGVAGDESLDNRVALLERESTASTVLLRQIKKQIEELKSSVADLKISSAISERSEEKRTNKFVKVYLPLILAALSGLIFPFTKVACERAKSLTDVEYKPDERLRAQIEADKRSHRAKVVQKKLHELERNQK